MADELRTERAKASSALQDRARKIVEIEGLKQKLQGQETLLAETETKLVERDDQLAQSLDKIKVLSRNEESLLRSIEDLESKLHETEEKNKFIRNEKHELTLALDHLHAELNHVTEALEISEAKSVTKEKLASDLKSQLEVQMQQHELHEEKIFYLTDQIREKVRNMDAVQETVSRVQSLEASDKFLNQMCEDLKKELEICYAKNNQLSNQAMEDSLKRTEDKGKYDHLKELLETTRVERDGLQIAAADWEKAHDELARRICAEAEAAELARHQADIAKKEVALVQSQLEELTRTHHENCQQNARLEESIAASKLASAAMQQELASLQKAAANEIQLRQELQKCQGALRELDELRVQHMELRKECIRKDMEAGVSELSNSMHTGQRTAIHEEIIADLRQELTDMHAKNTRLTKELDDALRKCLHLTRVEEDLRLMKETAQIVTAERNSANLAAMEASERSLKALHNRDILVRDLNRAEADAMQAKAEVQQLREEIATERQKYRKLHVEKLGCERTSAEFVAVSARAEAAMEEEKEKYTVSQVELERAKRTIREQGLVITKLREKLTTLSAEQEPHITLSDVLAADKGVKSSSWNSTGATGDVQSQLLKQIADNKELEAVKSELQQTRHSKSLLQREIDTLKQSVRIQREGFDNALAESLRLHQNGERLKAELEGLKALHTKSGISKEWEMKESELAVHRLRSELDDTLSRWTKVDAEHSHKNQLISQLQAELSREREKAVLLKSQATVLDDRLHTATDELSGNLRFDASQRQLDRRTMIGKLSAETDHVVNQESIGVFSAAAWGAAEAKVAPDDYNDHVPVTTPARMHINATIGATSNLGFSMSASRGGSLRLSDFQMTPGQPMPVSQTYDSRALDRSSQSKITSTTRIAERSPYAHPTPEIADKHHHPVTKQHLDSKEQLRRRREERERNRNKALRENAFYNASHGSAALPAKLDLQQARQLLASRR